MLHRTLTSLQPRMADVAKKAIDAMNADKKLLNFGVCCVLISETKRDLSTQLLYWMRGRMMDPLDTQLAYNKTLGWKPSIEECRKTVTWTLESKHLIGLAIDICPSKDGKTFWWNAPADVWSRIGEIGKQSGLKWGGDWQNKDSPHFEL